MSHFFEELESQLHAAARERTRSRRHLASRRVRLGWLRTALPVAMALTTTVAVAALALVLLGHHAPRAAQRVGAVASGPPHVVLGGTPYAPLTGGTPLERQELAYVNAATKRVLNSAACRPQVVNRTAVLSQRAPSRQLLSILGVLRGPATPTDRLDMGANATLPPQGETVYVRYIRLARRFGSVSFYVVPAGHWPTMRTAPERCYDAQTRALHDALPHIPASQRAGTLSLLAQQIAGERRSDRSSATDGVCLQAVTARAASGTCLNTAAEIARWGTFGGGGTGTSDLFTGLVPDGVRSVTLRFGPHGHWKAVNVTGDVVGNVFIVRAARAAYGLFPRRILWRDASGRVIKIVTVPWAG